MRWSGTWKILKHEEEEKKKEMKMLKKNQTEILELIKK